MRDFKYLALVTKNPEWERWMKSIANVKTKELGSIAKAFKTSFDRITGFSIMPSEISFMAMRDQQLADYAAFETTGKIKPEYFQQLKNLKSNLPKYNKIFEREARKVAKKGKTYALKGVKQGVSYIEEQLKLKKGMQVSMEAIMAWVVIESWAAFETLAADVWYAALKVGPEQWRKRTALKLQKKSTDAGSLDSLDINTVSDPGWSYFSFVRDTDGASFQRLPLIKDWYRTTFGKKVQQKLFSADVYVDALSAVRNVIAHKAGVADRIYVDAVKTFPELNSASKDHPILLDGEIVSKLRDSAVVVGNELLSFVDNQLRHRKMKA